MPATLPGLNDCAVETAATVLSQDRVADHTYRLRLRCPEIAERIRPGQFFMLRDPAGTDPLLGRPFALYDTFEEDGRPAGVDLGYHTVGKLTGRMPAWVGGEHVGIWGPLGNGFPDLDGGRLLFVAGGIGYTPAVAVMRQALGRKGYAGDPPRRRFESVEMIYGARTASMRADCSDFEGEPGFTLSVCTDDGSEGHAGRVTDLLAGRLAGDRPDAVLTCGPGVMMRAVAEACGAAGVACWLSLESPMACGFGACFSCVAKVKTDADPGWDYRRTCVEGPVFRGDELLLDELNC